MTLKLQSLEIKNFKSLVDTTLNFDDLTIIIGANSSGKSNSLEALEFLTRLVKIGSPPPAHYIQDFMTVGSNGVTNFTIIVSSENGKRLNYNVAVDATGHKILFSHERLCLLNNNIQQNNNKEMEVIKINNGKGFVRDENGKNPITYGRSETGKLALTSAGEYGEKPLTSQLSQFISQWEFYDLDPDIIRGDRQGIVRKLYNLSLKGRESLDAIPKLDSKGGEVQNLLLHCYEHDKSKFNSVNEEIQECLGVRLEIDRDEDEEQTVVVVESDRLKVPIHQMSDGTLRIIAYLLLLQQEQLPPLIGIEEPERNLHPGLLNTIATILKKISR